MANYYLSGDYNNTIDVILSITEHTDTTANTSTFDYTLYIYKKNNTSYSYSRGNHYAVTIGGFTTGDQTAGYSLGGIPIGGTYTLLTGTSSAIAHNSDGSGTVTVSAYVRQDQLANYSFSLSQSVAMTNIPRASKPSANNVTIGNAVTINTNRASSSFTHTLQYKLGTMSSYMNLATNVGASYSWTVPISVIDYISNAASATVTINCITYNGSTQIGTATCTFTATIPSSTISLSSSAAITMGTAKNVTVTNAASSKLTVSVTWSYGNKSNQALTSSFGTYSYNWPVATFASCIPAVMSGSVTVTQTTKRGTATINTSSAPAFTLTLPDANKNPSISSISLSDANGYAASYGSYLSGKSRLTWTINASAGSGSSINYYFLSVTNLDNQSTRTGAVDIPPSVGTGTKTVTARVRDQRYGSSGSEQVSLSTTIPVIQYKAPYLTSTTVVRSNSSGTADPASGTYIRMKGTVNWTRITGGSSTNSVSAKYRTRQQNGSWSAYTNLALSNDQFDVTTGTFSYEVGWEVQIVVTDAITTGGVTYSYTVGSAVFPIDVYPSQTSGIAFGKVSTNQGIVDSGWPLYPNAGLFFKNATALPSQTSSSIFLCMDSFADGGRVKWINRSNIIAGSAELLAPTGAGAFTSDTNGNFTHKRTTTTDYWHLNANDGTATFAVYWESGTTLMGQCKYFGHVINGSNGTDNMWVCLGTLVSSGDSANTVITVHSGDGYNANGRQNTTIRITVKDSWQSEQAVASSFGAVVEFLGSNNITGDSVAGVEVQVRATAYNTCLVWVKFPWTYWNGEYTVEGRYTTWTHNGTTRTTAPTGGTAQSVIYRYNIGFGNQASGCIRLNYGENKFQIAWKNVDWTGAISNAWNTLYESTAAISLGNWHSAFAGRPSVTYSAIGKSTARGVMVQHYGIPSTTSAGSVYLVNTGSIASQAYTVSVIGIGPY